MDLNDIKKRLQAAKRTSETKHYKVAISELVGVLIDLVDKIQPKEKAPMIHHHPTNHDKFDGVEIPPSRHLQG